MVESTKFRHGTAEIRRPGVAASMFRLLRDGIAARAQAIGSVPASRTDHNA
ncbi:hypothetical protein [Novosphingobium guangzhouense]|uniref:hypothetical protein n=1 Tax=Novosphingobium guangzhouense TaxID=1850347 RepID=UPI0014732DEE|nr:hypothetical protein [Novosphingobium guangzhouense]